MKTLSQLLFLLLFPCLLLAEGWKPGDEVAHFQVELQQDSPRAGEAVRLVVTVELEDKWHIYSVLPQSEDAPPPTRITFENNPFTLDGPFYETKAVVKNDAAIGLVLAFHEEKANFYHNLKVPESLSGQGKLEFDIWFQACNDRICLPPKAKRFILDYEIESGPLRAKYAAADRSIDEIPRGGIAGTGAKNLKAFIILAALMGLASLLTPCVFPMIPITVSYFSKQAEGDHKTLLKLSSVFGLGIVGTYTGTGLLLSLIFGAGAATRLATNPFVNLGIAVVFVIFALSLIGLFNIDLPSSLQGYFDKKARKLGGIAGVLLMGFTFTLTAFTCTVQFVGTLLITAASGEWMWPLLGMLVFSSVFAFPFFLLALSPGLIKSMQGSIGNWLGRSKVVLGILELMASVKFLSNADLVWETNLISRDFNLWFWLLCLTIIVIYLLWTALRPRFERHYPQVGVALVFLFLLGLTSTGLGDRSLGGLMDSLLPPPSSFSGLDGDFATKEEIQSLKWYHDPDEAFKAAKEHKKQVFLEFTGYTCINCRWMDQKIIARKEVIEVLKRDYILLKLYTDGGDKAEFNLNYQIKRFHTVALPYYARLKNEEDKGRSFIGIARSTEEFVSFLKSP